MIYFKARGHKEAIKPAFSLYLFILYHNISCYGCTFAFVVLDSFSVSRPRYSLCLSLFIAYSGWSVAVPMWRVTRHHSCRSAAFRQAVWMLKFIWWTSSVTTRSHVKLGLPWGRFQDDGGFCIGARTAWRWTLVGCARATWPKKCSLLAGKDVFEMTCFVSDGT